MERGATFPVSLYSFVTTQGEFHLIYHFGTLRESTWTEVCSDIVDCSDLGLLDSWYALYYSY
jgi:hypothetical protein